MTLKCRYLPANKDWRYPRSTRTTVLSCISIAFIVSGCFAPPDTSGNSNATNAPTTSPTLTPAAGPRAAKIIFKVPVGGSDSGSFDKPEIDGQGTYPSPGLGLQAKRVFNPDGTILSSAGPDSATWPKWLTRVEVGVSGSANPAAKNPDCARFATTTEQDTAGECFNSVDCSAPSGYFRVSEFDCITGVTNEPDIVTGNGGADDGVYVRAHFSREAANLDPSENIMAVIEYSASALSAPENPASCFTGGVFTPEECTDVNWKIYLRSSASAAPVPPYMLFIPPTVGVVNSTLPRGGTGVSTRQIFLPLASDSTLQVFQLSRIKSRLLKNNANFITACSNGTGLGNSPLCVGMILYSITFYRM